MFGGHKNYFQRKQKKKKTKLTPINSLTNTFYLRVNWEYDKPILHTPKKHYNTAITKSSNNDYNHSKDFDFVLKTGTHIHRYVQNESSKIKVCFCHNFITNPSIACASLYNSTHSDNLTRTKGKSFNRVVKLTH